MNLPALIQSLQEANRTIDDLRDTRRGWKIQYDRLYRQHMKLQRQRRDFCFLNRAELDRSIDRF